MSLMMTDIQPKKSTTILSNEDMHHETGILGGMSAQVPLTGRQVVFAALLSMTILGTYLVMNMVFYPGYPIINEYADQSQSFTEHYPPFRMNEWLYYEITRELVDGIGHDHGSLAQEYPIGYPLFAMPMVRMFGESGMYYANAFIIWACAIVFFWVVRVTAGFGAAMIWTTVLAFASPNLFFAASAYAEPLGQLFLLISTVSFLLSIVYPSKRWLFLVLSGSAAGFQLFIIPYLSFVVFISATAIVAKGWHREGVKGTLISLLGGFAGMAAIYVIVNLILLRNVPLTGLLQNGYLDGFNFESMYYSGSNALVSFLKMLFDSPHGALFIMPMIMLTPLGILAMWRRGSRTLAAGTVITTLYVLVITTVCECPISGEVVGTRQFGTLVPFLVLPLAFLGQERLGEKVWLGFTVLLTVYQCSFGWWLGHARGEGVFVGVLNDREARFIILARKGQIEQPVFRSSSELRDHFNRALDNNDIKGWFECLDSTTIEEITGFERVIFQRLVTEARRDDRDIDHYILSVDPDHGIRLNIPDIFFMQPESMLGLP